MDELFGLFWAIILISVGVSSVKKKKPQQKQEPRIPYEEAFDTPTPPSAAKPKPVQSATPAAPKFSPAQPMVEPAVHVHDAPACAVHDAAGSLNVVSPEGVDPCHASQLPDMHQPRPAAAVATETPGLTLDWTGDSMVRAIILQEVLQRPCQRRMR